MQATAKVQRWLGGLCGVTLLVGVVAAATHDDSDDPPAVNAVGAGSSTTVATALPGETVATLPGGEPAPTTAATAAPDGGGGGDPAAPTAPPATTPDSGAPTPAPPVIGTYRYEVTGDDGTASTYTLTIAADDAAPSDRLIGADTASLGLVERYRWDATGVYVVGGRFAALQDASCEWQPPVLHLKAPVVAGTTWDGSATCTATTSVGAISVQSTMHTTIVELIDFDAAGRTRRAARVSRDEDQVVTLGSNTVTSTGHYDDVVDVATGMVLQSTASVTTDEGTSGTERHLTEAPADW